MSSYIIQEHERKFFDIFNLVFVPLTTPSDTNGFLYENNKDVYIELFNKNFNNKYKLGTTIKNTDGFTETKLDYDLKIIIIKSTEDFIEANVITKNILISYRYSNKYKTNRLYYKDENIQRELSLTDEEIRSEIKTKTSEYERFSLNSEESLENQPCINKNMDFFKSILGSYFDNIINQYDFEKNKVNKKTI